MRILIAPDKFKLSLSATVVASILASEFAALGHESMVCPLADGGEGTFNLLTASCGGTIHRHLVSDPLGRKVEAEFGRSPDGSTAFIDMSQAAGLFRVDTGDRDPERTTTFGVGELILEAIRLGAVEIILGCGGSATNDGGAGMAAALGYRFTDPDGYAFIPTGGSLHRIMRIISDKVHPSIGHVRFNVVSDVTNPFTGPYGAAAVFAPQKGADPEGVKRLDHGLSHLAGLFNERPGFNIDQVRGAGAGGGFTGGAVWFLGAESLPGAEWVMKRTGFMDQLLTSDLVVTGEGRLDDQSLSGKLVGQVVSTSNKFGIPCQVICGQHLLDPAGQAALGAAGIWSLSALAGSPAAAMEDPETWLRKAAGELMRSLK